MQIGRKLYFDRVSGEIILETAEAEGNVREILFEEYLEYKPEIENADVIELGFGEYSELFVTKKASVNPVTKELIFTDLPPPEPMPEPIDEEKVLMAETIIALEMELEQLRGGIPS